MSTEVTTATTAVLTTNVTSAVSRHTGSATTAMTSLTHATASVVMMPSASPAVVGAATSARAVSVVVGSTSAPAAAPSMTQLQDAMVRRQWKLRGRPRSQVFGLQRDKDCRGVVAPDCVTPFKDYKDVVKRLVKYHVLQTRDPEPQHLQQGQSLGLRRYVRRFTLHDPTPLCYLRNVIRLNLLTEKCIV